MGKLNYRKLSRAKHEALGRIFWSTCTKSKSTQELTRFIEGLLSPSEKLMATRRILIAQKLLKGKTQSEIMTELEVGQSTVDAVERWLQTVSASTKKMLS